jgi:hypothetical protein
LRFEDLKALWISMKRLIRKFFGDDAAAGFNDQLSRLTKLSKEQRLASHLCQRL